MILPVNGKNILIDAGSGKDMIIQESEPGMIVSEVDMGKEVIVPYLKKNNIFLDGVIILHPHSDHSGGLLSIFDEGFYPKWFMDAKLESSSIIYLEILNRLREKNIEYKIAKPEDKIFLNEEVLLEVLGPITKYEEYMVDRAINNSSIVLKLTYKNFSCLFSGDIETFAEMDLLEYRDKLKSTILKVPHHGSSTSSSIPFLDMVKPQVAIISCGKGNSFGHPHQDTLERLDEIKAVIFRTDQNGK